MTSKRVLQRIMGCIETQENTTSTVKGLVTTKQWFVPSYIIVQYGEGSSIIGQALEALGMDFARRVGGFKDDYRDGYIYQQRTTTKAPGIAPNIVIVEDIDNSGVAEYNLAMNLIKRAEEVAFGLGKSTEEVLADIVTGTVSASTTKKKEVVDPKKMERAIDY